MLIHREELKRQFDSEEGSFMLIVYNERRWDWDEFKKLTWSMYQVAHESQRQSTIETWIAQGFWYCDTWIRDFTRHPDFPHPERQAHNNAIELISNLAYFLFCGESPFIDDTLERQAKMGILMDE
jgi:hypothetical protein